MWERGGNRIAEAEAMRFRARRKELGLGPLVIHDNYLINLASPNPVLRTRSVQAFHQELVRAIALGADFLVAHPGSGRESSPAAAVSAISQGLKQAARGLKLGDLKILLENTAGQGTSIGSRFEELRAILDASPGPSPRHLHRYRAHFRRRMGHAHRRRSGNHAPGALTAPSGLDRVYVIHVNDSKTPHGSRVDRHEHIGKGKIGLEAFRPHSESSRCSRAARSSSKRRSISPATTAATSPRSGNFSAVKSSPPATA